MDLNLSGRHALVCGASEGIGRAAAIELALLGCDVTVLARRQAMLQQLVAELPVVQEGQTHGWLFGDDGKTEMLSTDVVGLAARKPVHVLINNGGGPPGGRAIDADLDAYLTAFRHHTLANHVRVQAVLPGMRAAGWGRIVNVVSTSVYEPIPNLGVSNTIRASVAGWAKTLSRELGPDGITINNVLPGFTRTARMDHIVQDRMQANGQSAEQILDGIAQGVPVRRIGEAADIAAAIAFLASPAAGYITGVSLAVDGGRLQSI
ncbi:MULTISPECIES: SDR family oxidoreductase [Pseudoxanthomonas]|uniref:3-oxoacyl-[acyl-carrier protein] reductase n=1 Tax=Pseudoxanthomonas winnipegensis TaxID=2480810 RepID=A0AAW8G9W1_9GAMM|nr:MULTISPECIES: SDR family oxidoreductase [Pseudoxanthomonas]MDQ1118978.1 3-oxoacyl-[acyl-carrier protein] reductase [Pseudoxanthomonas winnipegensis]MDQ1132167.1 3-oxoacyl-[acyl-carrier protein] reductase [Pseudoxanthomonas winnipegensis]MDR6137821.1 3-oxoacyl-[acyl-carrier protein] reductase [Pseudoxanthomonas sp. SORGH_AS_0997]